VKQINPARIACAFRAALHFLAGPNDFKQSPVVKQEFICVSIDLAIQGKLVDADVGDAAIDVIMERIYPALTVNEWAWSKNLLDINNKDREGCARELQEFRHRWVNELAREFFAKAPEHSDLLFPG
jgi:hypothetical protein